MSVVLCAKDQAALQAISYPGSLVALYHLCGGTGDLEITQSNCGGFSQKQGLLAAPTAQVVEGLSGMQDDLGSILSTIWTKSDGTKCCPNIWEVEARGSGVKGHHWLQSDFKASLGWD